MEKYEYNNFQNEIKRLERKIETLENRQYQLLFIMGFIYLLMIIIH